MNNRMQARLVLFVALIVATLTSCEKAGFDGDEQSSTGQQDANVVLRLSVFDMETFGETSSTRAYSDISELATRLNLVVLKNGEKVKTVSQKQGDSSFGTVALSLAEGTYQVVAIAHNCDGTATITSADKITFPNNIVTDTFYYYDDLTVGSTAVSQNLTMRRAVAMFRLILTDDLPASVRKLKFYYTGGSSTFSALSGYGCVNSRQTVNITVSDGQKVFEVYTFPHDEQGELKMTITALDAQDNAVGERVFESVPVARNYITRYTGSLLGGGTNAPESSGIRFSVDGDWSGENADVF